MKMKPKRRCSCQLCRLARCLTRISRKCTPVERVALDVLWGRMESAETNWDWLHSKAQNGEPIKLCGRMYEPNDQAQVPWRGRPRLMLVEDWRLICEVMELVIAQAEERYKQQKRKERNESSKNRTARTR